MDSFLKQKYRKKKKNEKRGQDQLHAREKRTKIKGANQHRAKEPRPGQQKQQKQTQTQPQPLLPEQQVEEEHPQPQLPEGGQEKQSENNDEDQTVQKQRKEQNKDRKLAKSKQENKENQNQQQLAAVDQLSSFNFTRCDYLNISICNITQTSDSILVNFYNPSSRSVHTYARFPVNTKKVVTFGPNGKPVHTQIQNVTAQTTRLRIKFKGNADYELIFPVSIPALGFTTYFITKNPTNKFKNVLPKVAENITLSAEDRAIENKYIKLIFDPITNKLASVRNKLDNTALRLSQDFFYYKGSPGDMDIQTSGAYIFRPVKQRKQPIPVHEIGKVKSFIIRGPLVNEVHQVFSSYASQVIRLYKNKPFTEFEHTIGPLPVGAFVGKELITRFRTNISNNGIFYTDANGREMKKRKRDHRDTYEYNVDLEPISSNYYPINSRIFINDTSRQLTILTDRSQGGSSIKDGDVEVMVHRRLMKDDYLGVDQKLDEMDVDGRGLVTRGKHRVFVTSQKKAARLHRMEGEGMMMEPIVSFANTSYSYQRWTKNLRTKYTGLTSRLPPTVHILTMETTSTKNQILLRLEHFFENDENAVYSKPAKVKLDGLFSDFDVLSIEELNLSANQHLREKRMWTWKTNDKKERRSKRDLQSDFDDENFVVWLNPMDIRTFLLVVEYHL